MREVKTYSKGAPFYNAITSLEKPRVLTLDSEKTDNKALSERTYDSLFPPT